MNSLSGASTIITVTKIVASCVSNEENNLNEDKEKNIKDTISDLMKNYVKKTPTQKQPNENLDTSRRSLAKIHESNSQFKSQTPILSKDTSMKTLEKVCKKSDSPNVPLIEPLNNLRKNTSFKQSFDSQENDFSKGSDKNQICRQQNKTHSLKALNQASLQNFEASNNILKSINSKQSSKNVLPPFDKYFFSPSKESPLKVHQFKQRKRLLNRKSVGQSSLSSKSYTSVKSSYNDTPKQIESLDKKNNTLSEPDTKSVKEKTHLSIAKNKNNTDKSKIVNDRKNETFVNNDLVNSHKKCNENELKGGSILFFNNMFKKDSEIKKNYCKKVEGKSMKSLNNFENDKKEQFNTPLISLSSGTETIVDNSVKITGKAVESLQNKAKNNSEKISEITTTENLDKKADKITATETVDNPQVDSEIKDFQNDFKLFEDDEPIKEVKKSKKRGRPRTRNIGIDNKNNIVVKTKKSILNDEEVIYKTKNLEKEEKCHRIKTRFSRNKIKKKCSCENSIFHHHCEDGNDTDDDFELSLKHLNKNVNISSDSDESMNEAFLVPSLLQKPVKEIKTHRKIFKRGSQEAVNSYIKFLPTSHHFPTITEEDVELFKIAHKFYLQHKNGILDILKSDKETCPSENTEAIDNDYEDTISNVSSCVPPKRKRGRPKKINNINNNNSSVERNYKESEKIHKSVSTSEKIDTVVVKRKRGRPKKTVVDGIIDKSKIDNINNMSSLSNQKKNEDSDTSITDDNFDGNISNIVVSKDFEDSSATIDPTPNGQIYDSDRSEHFKEKNPPFVKKQRLISSMLKELEKNKNTNDINDKNTEINSTNEINNYNQRNEQGFGLLSKESFLSFESLNQKSKPVLSSSSFLSTSTSFSNFQSSLNFPILSSYSSSSICSDTPSYLPPSFRSFRGCGTAFAQSFTPLSKFSSSAASLNFNFSTSFSPRNNVKNGLFKNNNLVSFSSFNTSTEFTSPKSLVSDSIKAVSSKNISIFSHSTINRCSCKHYCGLNGPLSPLEHQKSIPFQNTLSTEHLNNISANEYEMHSNHSFQLKNNQSFNSTSQSIQPLNKSLSCQQLPQQTFEQPQQAQKQIQLPSSQQFQQSPQQVLLIQAPQLLSLVQHLLQQKQPNVPAPNFQNIINPELSHDLSSMKESYHPQINTNVVQQMNHQENIATSSQHNTEFKQPCFQPQITSASDFINNNTISHVFNSSIDTTSKVVNNITEQVETNKIALNDDNVNFYAYNNVNGKSINNINDNKDKISQVKLLEFLKDTLKDNTFASVGNDLTRKTNLNPLNNIPTSVATTSKSIGDRNFDTNLMIDNMNCSCGDITQDKRQNDDQNNYISSTKQLIHTSPSVRSFPSTRFSTEDFSSINNKVINGFKKSFTEANKNDNRIFHKLRLNDLYMNPVENNGLDNTDGKLNSENNVNKNQSVVENETECTKSKEIRTSDTSIALNDPTVMLSCFNVPPTPVPSFSHGMLPIQNSNNYHFNQLHHHMSNDPAISHNDPPELFRKYKQPASQSSNDFLQKLNSQFIPFNSTIHSINHLS